MKFAIKKISKPKKRKFPMVQIVNVEQTPIQELKPMGKISEEIIETKKVNDMDTKEKIAYAKSVLSDTPELKVKKVKKEKGLIERTENSKIILTEDNKELLND